VRQAGRGPGLAAEPVVDLGRVRRGLHDLDRDLAVEGEVTRQVDGAHPAASEEADEPVLALDLGLERGPHRIALGGGERSGGPALRAEARVLVEPVAAAHAAAAGSRLRGRRLQALLQQAGGA
jgi:hypothetical protein